MTTHTIDPVEAEVARRIDLKRQAERDAERAAVEAEIAAEQAEATRKAMLAGQHAAAQVALGEQVEAEGRLMALLPDLLTAVDQALAARRKLRRATRTLINHQFDAQVDADALRRAASALQESAAW